MKFQDHANLQKFIWIYPAVCEYESAFIKKIKTGKTFTDYTYRHHCKRK